MNLIDTHAHLSDPAFSYDIDAVLERAYHAGVSAIIAIGTDYTSSEQSVALAHRFDTVWASIGLHPQEAEHISDWEHELKRIESLSKEERVVAWGEIGLDYYRIDVDNPASTSVLSMQKELLRAQLTLACTHSLPVILHNRASKHDMLLILKEVPPFSGVLHCFDGDSAFLERILSLGLFVGFDGNITYKNAEALRQRVVETPSDRLLLETDAPYLTPVPHRGERCEPMHLVHTLACASDTRSTDQALLSHQTTNNARSLFSLD